MQFLEEQEDVDEEQEEEDEEEYVSAEERLSGRMEEPQMESPQSLDYMTTYETNSLETSEVSTGSSLASDVEKQSLNAE